jgi:RHS repeat-associated protein
VGDYYEKSGTTVKKYYYANSTRIAMNDGGTTKYLFGDHLGSMSIVTDDSGNKLTPESKYKAWGEARAEVGVFPSTFRYTGQRQEMIPGWVDGLDFYNSRWYDPSLGRFLSPDPNITDPGNPIDYDRYAYVRNNPLRYVDPSGNEPRCVIYLDGACALYTSLVLYNQDLIYSSVNIHPPSELDGRYGLGAQYIPVINSRLYRTKYPQREEPYVQTHHTLCGHLAFTAIYETMVGGPALDEIWNAYPTAPGGLSDSSWARVINGMPGWSATTHYFHKNRNTKDEMKAYLDQGVFIMISVCLDTNTGRLVNLSDDRGVGHWVDVVSVNNKGVTIYDPFTNANHFYTWADFDFDVAILITYRKPKTEKTLPTSY